MSVVQAMAYGENGKKWSVNCLLDSASEKLLIRTDVADELVLSGTPSAVSVRGVHVLSAGVGDSPQRSASRAFAMISFELRCPGHVKSIENPLGRTPATPPCLTSCQLVFDGSGEWNGTFLSNCLDPGPSLQPDLVAVLLRFRRSRIALLRLEDRDVCRLLWQERDCGAPVKVYPITWVGFGLTCSPFMAMQVVRQHAQGCGNIDALTDRVLSDMYVDDLATSCDG
ncbi:hypothetical protein T05_5954, partial [Trichinella murrelli]